MPKRDGNSVRDPVAAPYRKWDSLRMTPRKTLERDNPRVHVPHIQHPVTLHDTWLPETGTFISPFFLSLPPHCVSFLLQSDFFSSPPQQQRQQTPRKPERIIREHWTCRSPYSTRRSFVCYETGGELNCIGRAAERNRVLRALLMAWPAFRMGGLPAASSRWDIY